MSKKVILITGASSGIGKATAELLAKQGHVVYAAARRLEKMEDLKAFGVKTLQMDVTKHEDVVNSVETVIKNEGRIDVLFNNAGYGLYGALEDISIEDAKYQYDVNIFGLADVTKQVLPYMREQKSGTIINTSSMGGKVYTPLGSWYHSTKHALEGWSDCLRLDLKQFGIDVVIIEPGIIRTEFADVVSSQMKKNSKEPAYSEYIDKVAKATQQTYAEGNGSSPDVIAELVLKAISDKNPKTRYVAGKLAKPFMFLRKMVSDRMFDKIVMSQIYKRN
jgi:short-subunit dehydrogenase